MAAGHLFPRTSDERNCDQESPSASIRHRCAARLVLVGLDGQDAGVAAPTTRRPMTPVYSSLPVARHRKLCPVGSVNRSCTSSAAAPIWRQALHVVVQPSGRMRWARGCATRACNPTRRKGRVDLTPCTAAYPSDLDSSAGEAAAVTIPCRGCAASTAPAALGMADDAPTRMLDRPAGLM